MRTRPLYPLLFLGTFLLLTTLLILWGSPALTGWASGGVWTDLDGPSGGQAQAVALNPDYPVDQTVFAGGGEDTGYASWLGEGIFRSLDGGRTWGAPAGPANGALMDIAFSPRWHDDGMAAAGFYQGIWTTHDRGVTWTQISGIDFGGPGWLGAVAITSPTAGQYTLLAGGMTGGLYRSADEGTTWTYLFDPGGVRRLAFAPAALEVAYAATGTGIWRTPDAGLQWTHVLTTTGAADVAVGPDSRVYAIIDSQVAYSDDDGATWQPIPGPTLQYMPTLGLSADGAGLFTAGGPNLYRYDIGSNRMLTVTTDLVTGYIHRLALSPAFASDNTILVGDLNGVWISQDAGATFVRKEGFAPLPVRSMQAVGDRHDGDLFAGGKNGIWRHDGEGWHSLNTGILGTMSSMVVDLALSPDFANDRTLFAVQLPGVGLGSTFLRSADAGQTWQTLLAGKEYMNQVVLSPDFVHDRRVYLVAVKKIWASSDSGDTMVQDPFWDDTHTVRFLTISPNFALDHTLVAAGDKVYRSTDGGSTWQVAASAPVLSPLDGVGWRPTDLIWSSSGQLYFAIYMYDAAAPYARHDQIWSSSDQGQTWQMVSAAPNRPIASLAAGSSSLGNGKAIYVSTYDDNEADDQHLGPDLYVSRDNGSTWSNLGAIPGGAAQLEAPLDVPDQVWAGSQGVWQLAAGTAPTATPNPVRELLSNLSFEYTGVWRIPDTPYDAAYSQEQHYAGYWSMRTGITAPNTNVRAYSDFSQDVTLPTTGTVTLRFQRWAQSAISTTLSTQNSQLGNLSGSAVVAVADGATLEEFQAALEAAAGDLQYGLLIEQPSNKIHYLYKGLDNQRTWKAETFDLTAYLGKSVRLQFGTYNDGSGAAAAQFFDVFSLQAVSPGQPTPTVTPAVTPTATVTPRAQMWMPYLLGGLVPEGPTQ